MRVDELTSKIEELKSRGISIDLSRGKPSKLQLDLSNSLLNNLTSVDILDKDGIDLRNYSNLDSSDSCKSIFSFIFGINTDNIIVYGNSSLFLEYNLICDSYMRGVLGCLPWSKLEKVKWICLVPGYDRHFALCEYFGMEMISVPMSLSGPDMDLIEKLVKDPTVKGVWCTPIYSNPLGITFDDETVKRFAALKPAAKDFRIYWDMAYAVHHLSEPGDKLLNLFEEAKRLHNEDLVYLFSSTSKITFAGSGIAAVGCSETNRSYIMDNLRYKSICADKLNQKRHSLFLKSPGFIAEHMSHHAAIIRPKFEGLIRGLAPVADICKIIVPNGGYFISIFVKPGTARKVIQRCSECGLKLTEAGCGYPYHNDPSDSHIRLAPTCLEESEIEIASSILATCIELEYLLSIA